MNDAAKPLITQRVSFLSSQTSYQLHVSFGLGHSVFLLHRKTVGGNLVLHVVFPLGPGTRWGLFLGSVHSAAAPRGVGLRGLYAIEPIGGTSDAVHKWMHSRSADSINRKLPGSGEDQVSHLVKAPPPSGQDFRKTNN
jgi:hypothetical protein